MTVAKIWILRINQFGGVVSAHRGDSAAAIHVVINLAIRDVDVCVAEHTACGDAELWLLACFLVVHRTATAAKHVAVPAARGGRADGAIRDGDAGIALHVAVSRAAIHAVHDGAAVDGDVSVAGICLVGELV